MPPVNRIDASRVRQLIAKGASPKQIAQRLGCNKVSIHKIARELRAGK